MRSLFIFMICFSMLILTGCARPRNALIVPYAEKNVASYTSRNKTEALEAVTSSAARYCAQQNKQAIFLDPPSVGYDDIVDEQYRNLARLAPYGSLLTGQFHVVGPFRCE